MGIVIAILGGSLILATFALRMATWIALGSMLSYLTALGISAMALVMATLISLAVDLLVGRWAHLAQQHYVVGYFVFALCLILIEFAYLADKPIIARVGVGVLHLTFMYILAGLIVGASVAASALWPGPLGR
jgi:hypothetical protein